MSVEKKSWGWQDSGEYHCPCGMMFGKNLRGESPSGLVHQHVRTCVDNAVARLQTGYPLDQRPFSVDKVVWNVAVVQYAAGLQRDLLAAWKEADEAKDALDQHLSAAAAAIEAERQDARPGDRVPVFELVELAQRQGGFSWQVAAGGPGRSFGPASGYAVSIEGRECKLAMEGGGAGNARRLEAMLSAYVNANADLLLQDNCYFLGGWVEENESGKHLVYDVSTYCSDMVLAMRIARANRQRAIYSFAESCSIPVALEELTKRGVFGSL